MREAGQKGVAATCARLQDDCLWKDLVADGKDFVRQRHHCFNSCGGELVLRPYGDTVRGSMPSDVYFESLDVGDFSSACSVG